MKKNTIIISILIFIIFCLSCTLFFVIKNYKDINEKKTERIVKNVYVTEEKRLENKEYDLNNISMNGLRIGDSGKNAHIIMDYNYEEKNGIYIQNDDKDKIKAMSSSSNENANIKYLDNKLTNLADYIEFFGQYSEKIVHYNNGYENYDYLYCSYTKGIDGEYNYKYELVISCDKNNEIRSIELKKEKLYVMS